MVGAGCGIGGTLNVICIDVERDGIGSWLARSA